MKAARDLLELSALVSMRQNDIDGFERSLAQLQPFGGLGGSRLGPALVGLHLLLLLSRNEIARFHTTLEMLASEQGDVAHAVARQDPRC
jgi:26S proteasome regulatory subunit N12